MALSSRHAHHVQAFLARLDHVKETLRGWTARCPAHDDQHPSLDITIGEDERILVICRSNNCSHHAIVQALGLEDADLFRPDSVERSHHEEPIVYPYCDKNGELLFEVVRLPGKKFFQRRPDGRGGWVNNLKGVQPVLYRLPELLQADPRQPVFIPEGEKDVDNLRALGLIATTNPGGAGKWKSAFNEPLRHRHVVLLPDCDRPGREHVQAIAKQLSGTASTLKIVTLPGLAEKEDVSNWLQSGGTAEKLCALAEAAPLWTEPSHPPTPGLQLVNLAQVAIRPIKWLVPGFIPKRKVTILDGDPGSNKSTLAFALAAAVTTGHGTLLGSEYRDEPAHVLIVAPENGSDDTLAPRAIAAGADRSRIDIIEAALQRDGTHELLDLERHLPEIEATIAAKQTTLLLIDPIMSVLGSEVEPKNEIEARRIMLRLSQLAERTGVTILAIRHLNKDMDKGAMYRGTGSIGFTATARSVLLVARDPQADRQAGARIVCQVKVNLSADMPPWRFFVAHKDIPCTNSEEVNQAVYIHAWEQADCTADELLSPASRTGSPKMEAAKDLLAEQLANGPQPSSILLEMAEARDISPSTLGRAAADMRIIKLQRGRKHWYCALGQQPP